MKKLACLAYMHPTEAEAALVHARTYGAWFAAQPTWARLRWFTCFDEMAG